MDNQPTALLNWAFFCQGKSMDELRQWLLLTTVELENTRLKASEELKMRENQIVQLKDLLNRAIKEKNDAQEKCQWLLFERLLLQQSALMSRVSSIEDEPRRGVDHSNNIFSSSYSDENIVSSPTPQMLLPQELPIVIDKPLPEKGKFLQGEMKTGPFLQTLLLAGPLPQWRHPPPPIDSYQIPL